MTENIEKLVEIGKVKIMQDLEFRLDQVKKELVELSHGMKYGKGYNGLEVEIGKFKRAVDYVSKEFGVEFPGLQKQYEEMLPEINKYLEVKAS